LKRHIIQCKTGISLHQISDFRYCHVHLRKSYICEYCDARLRVNPPTADNRIIRFLLILVAYKIIKPGSLTHPGLKVFHVLMRVYSLIRSDCCPV
jgi:hypothetical protein